MGRPEKGPTPFIGNAPEIFHPQFRANRRSRCAVNWTNVAWAARDRRVTFGRMFRTAPRHLALAALLTALLPAAIAAGDGNRPPTASFTWTPSTPQTGDVVTFAATTADPEKDPVTVRWDLDGDGTYETTAAAPSARLTRGAHLVGLRATDSHGN